MPKRTNLFQEVVEIIHRHMAEDATVEASAMLIDSVTGDEREVDVVIRSRPAGYELVISVEAVGRSRPATVEWVEQMLGKHKNLPTDKLVLVAQRGFSKQARRKAESGGAVPVSPDDVLGEALSDVRSLWPKVITFTPEEFGVNFDDEDAPDTGWEKKAPRLYADASSLMANSLGDFVQRMWKERLLDLAEQTGLAKVTQDETRRVHLRLEDLRPKINGVRRHICLLNENGRLYSLARITVAGQLTIQVSEIKLTHGRLGDLDLLFSYGEGKVAGRSTLIVVSAPEGKEQGKMTFRIRPEK